MASNTEDVSSNLTLAAGYVTFKGAIKLDRVGQEFWGLVWSTDRW